MIEGLKPYPEYKDSGLPWLRSLPSNWRIVRNAGLFVQRNETGYGELPILEVSLNTGVKIRDFGASSRKQVMSNRNMYKRTKQGDIAYNMMRMWQGAVGVSPVDGLVSPAYVVAKPYPIVDTRYFVSLFRTSDYKAEIDNCSRGIVADRNRLYWDQFKQIRSPCPPRDEQEAIVKFLDHANAKIERAIRAKRKLIGLLNEQKQAIIHRAVTRGLDPNVKLKPSGIPWLGDVPEHWTLKRFKYIATINAGQVDPRKPKYRNMILIAPNHIRSGDGHLIEKETAADQGADSGKYMVTSGQIIYSKIRPNLRKATIAPCDCLCSADMYAISPKTSELSTDFLLALLLSQAFTKFAVDCSMRVAMPKVNRDALANCMLWFPGLSEQIEILQNVGNEVAPFDTAISRTQREIDLLLEYRTTLTAEVVTGKLDVREAAKRLPDEAVETLPPDDSMDEMIEDEIDQEDDA